jgi:hypothetical protein
VTLRSRDTAERAAAIQTALHDALGPGGRADLALQLSDFAREFAKAALRTKHLDYDERELLVELTRQLHGCEKNGAK